MGCGRSIPVHAWGSASELPRRDRQMSDRQDSAGLSAWASTVLLCARLASTDRLPAPPAAGSTLDHQPDDGRPRVDRKTIGHAETRVLFHVLHLEGPHVVHARNGYDLGLEI